MNAIPAFIIDAFASRPFAGNPAAVCVLHKAVPEAWMQSIASEFNLSETAFLLRLEPGLWSLRWFTPQCEVNLCGHATLASAHVLANELMVPHSVYRFATKSGELRAMGLDNGFQLDFPATSTAPLAANDVRNTQVKGGVSGLYQAGEDLLLELASAEAVQQFQPDLNAIRQLGCRGLIVTAAGEKGVDFVSRFFAPAYGIDEDPVTGSAHCGLADYWHRRLGKHHFIAKQVSKRGGDLEVMLEGNRVLLVGQAITTLRASLAV
jgi:PhzF family phenazine biosynthesis protein